jgi:hypothetical protein
MSLRTKMIPTYAEQVVTYTPCVTASLGLPPPAASSYTEPLAR